MVACDDMLSQGLSCTLALILTLPSSLTIMLIQHDGLQLGMPLWRMRLPDHTSTTYSFLVPCVVMTSSPLQYTGASLCTSGWMPSFRHVTRAHPCATCTPRTSAQTKLTAHTEPLHWLTPCTDSQNSLPVHLAGDR